MSVLKKVGIVFLSLIVLLLLVGGIGIWYIFTPSNLTSIVNKQAKNYLTCTTTIKKVEPTFFSTYPFFGVEINNLCLKEKSKDGSTKADTLVYTKKCLASVNVKSLIFDGDIILDPFYLEDGYVNFKVDKNQKTNLDILKVESTESTKETESSSTSLGNVNISNVEVKNFTAHYLDESMKMKADIKQLNAILSCILTKTSLKVNAKMDLKELYYQTLDSMAICMRVKNSRLKLTTEENADDRYKTQLEFEAPETFMSMSGDTFIKKMDIKAKLPFKINLANKKIDFESSEIKFDKQSLYFAGNVKMYKDSSIATDIEYSTNEWDIESLIALIPKAYAAPLKGLTAKGKAKSYGSVKGLYSNKTFPVVKANLYYKDGYIRYFNYPVVRNISTNLTAMVDMNEGKATNVKIHSSYAKVRRSTVKASGDLYDVMGDAEYSIKSNGTYYLSDFQSFIPKEYQIKVGGILKGDLSTRFKQAAIDKEAYHHVYVAGNLKTKNLAISMKDSMKVSIPSAKIKMEMPTHEHLNKDAKLVDMQISIPYMNMEMLPSMGAETHDLNLAIAVNDMIKGVSAPKTTCKFKLGKLSASADTLHVHSTDANGVFAFAPRKKGKKEVSDMAVEINSDNIAVLDKAMTMLNIKNFHTNTKLQYDETEKNAIAQWQPEAVMSFSDGKFDLGEKLKGEIPNTSFKLTPETLNIEKANIKLGNSDFNLSGKLTNLMKYLDKKALLKGDFDFVSKNTDITELMDLCSGIGTEDTTKLKEAKKVEVKKDSTQAEANPFIVPKGMDIHLNTLIEHARVNEHTIDNIKGGLTVKDGALILEQVGFTSKAANMQLTAVYKSPRKNHLFASIDFHLLNINIAELIDLVPQVDTMVPMLKSFKGRGEFHLAGETYMKKDYSLKKSTIRGAAAFEGQDLTLMDNATFTQIAKMLMFEKKTKNVVDSLNVEMTVFRDEVDLYPFLIVMDDYKAVIAGRHNLDNSFNYHISVTETPLPVRLGLNVTGTMDDLHYKLAKCKFKHLYSPKKQGKLEKQTLRLKKLISNSLKKNVKPIKK
ncbi:MAG: AsmA-like C-terminal region-containing protein [Marinifilaceae bacterium]|jgi:hypothetical protein|nr:AsmA-like C-terminal region-containing protein [Marinifilaceae bacterium]